MKLRKCMAASVASLLMAAAVVTVGTASPAVASGQGKVYPGTPVYDSYGCASGVIWYVNYESWLPFDCWIDSPYYPYDRFMRIEGTTDFIRTEHIDPEPGGLPHC